ncbi:MAG: OmpW/AlkL family protein, partial [Algiphilus sp.]
MSRPYNTGAGAMRDHSAVPRTLRRLLIPPLLVASLLSSAQAQEAGDVLIQAGWAHIIPREDNGAPRNRLRPNPAFPLLGVESSFSSESVRVLAGSVDTLGLVGQYFLTDHWALKLIVGYPPVAQARGRGIVRPTGPTGEVAQIDLSEPRFNPLGRARQWVPVFQVAYHLGPPNAAFRPFFSAGVAYAVFTGETLNETLKAEANQHFGRPLALAAGIPGPTHITSDLDPTLAPAFGTGIRWNVDAAWSLSLEFDVVALET